MITHTCFGILCMGMSAHMIAWLLFYVMLKLSPYLDAGAGPALCMCESQRSPGCHACCTASLNVMQVPVPHSIVIHEYRATHGADMPSCARTANTGGGARSLKLSQQHAEGSLQCVDGLSVWHPSALHELSLGFWRLSQYRSQRRCVHLYACSRASELAQDTMHDCLADMASNHSPMAPSHAPRTAYPACRSAQRAKRSMNGKSTMSACTDTSLLTPRLICKALCHGS